MIRGVAGVWLTHLTWWSLKLSAKSWSLCSCQWDWAVQNGGNRGCFWGSEWGFHCILRSQAVCNWTSDGLSTNPKTIVAATNLLFVVQRRCENRQLWYVENRKWTCVDIYSQCWLQVMLSVHGYMYCVYSHIIFQWHGESLWGFHCLKHIHDPLCFAALNPITRAQKTTAYSEARQSVHTGIGRSVFFTIMDTY